MRRLVVPTLLGALAAACGGSGAAPPVVLVETGGADAGAGATIEDLVRDDALAAAAVLTDGLTADDARIAGYCAVYARRLDLEHDRARSAAALARGAAQDDPLLQALSWRWIAADPAIDPPPWPGGAPADPAVGVLAALAFARRGPLPEPLAGAGGLPEGKPQGGARPPRERLADLAVATRALDDGPLALALGFVEARRERWVEPGPGGRPRWVAERLRAELAAAVLGEAAPPSALADSPAPVDPGYSALTEVVLTPLLAAPLVALRGAALKAEGELRVGALRALGVLVAVPRAGDLGASAAGLESDDPRIRVEAARTFLLLTARAIE